MGTPALAWRTGVTFGFGFAPPFYGPPPIYYPPPLYYAPPVYAAPAYPPPPIYYPTPANAGTCYAGRYVCPLDVPIPVGSECSCPANVGRILGRSG